VDVVPEVTNFRTSFYLKLQDSAKCIKTNKNPKSPRKTSHTHKERNTQHRNPWRLGLGFLSLSLNPPDHGHRAVELEKKKKIKN
jgi:hypothetical protein